MNVWNFTGNLGKDADQRFTPSGDSIVNFSVAVKAGFGDKATTTWVRCGMWGKRGESVLQYLNKGQLVGISGEASLREYDKDGVKHSSLEVRVNDLTLLGKSEGGAKDSQPKQASRQAAPPTGGLGDFEDEIPFNRISDKLAMVI